jgi:ribosomal protein L17
MLNREFKSSDFDFNKRKPSYSTLKHILKSPLHFALNWFAPKVKTDAMEFGSAFDCMLFDGEDAFLEKFVVSEVGINKGSKESCLASVELLEKVADQEKIKDIKRTISHTDKVSEIRQYIDELITIQKKSIVTNERFEQLQSLCNTFKNHPVAGKFYNNLVSVQRRMEWKDAQTGFEMVGYLDGETDFDGNYCIWDLKLTNDASTDGFMRNAMKFGYHIQAASYWNGYIQNTGRIVPFYFIAVEPDTGAINVMLCDNNLMDLGKFDYRNALDRLKYCNDNDCFNEDYMFMQSAGYNSLTAPGWELKRME